MFAATEIQGSSLQLWEPVGGPGSWVWVSWFLSPALDLALRIGCQKHLNSDQLKNIWSSNSNLNVDSFKLSDVYHLNSARAHSSYYFRCAGRGGRVRWWLVTGGRGAEPAWPGRVPGAGLSPLLTSDPSTHGHYHTVTWSNIDGNLIEMLSGTIQIRWYRMLDILQKILKCNLERKEDV